MSIWQALVLGVLQGTTEFLPVSSSGHLVLVPWWLNWSEPPLVFDVVVHLGTLVAVLMYFWRDWQVLLRAGLHALRNRTASEPEARLLWLIALGTVPAALAGLMLEGLFETTLSDPPLAASFLLVTAFVLVFSERASNSERTLTDLQPADALIIGGAQALAIFPGLSRSGSTIAAGLTRGMSRPAAARFSFLLATPIIMGAGIKQGFDLLVGGEPLGNGMVAPLLIGFTTSLVMGYLCVWGLLRLLQRRRLYGFAAYCATFGTLSLVVALFA
jgi:undecaprenyl-diphosphatase